MSLREAIQAQEEAESQLTPFIQEEEQEPPITLNERILTVPAVLSSVGVEADNNAERIFFDFPDSWDGISFRDKIVSVEWINAKSDRGSYLAKDVEFNGDRMTFSWLLGYEVVAYPGTIQFAVKISGEDYRFGSQIATATVANGIVNDGSITIPPEASDVFDEWYALMGAKLAEVQEIKDAMRISVDKAQTLADRYSGLNSSAINATAAATSALAQAQEAIQKANEAINQAQASPVSEQDYLNGFRYIGDSFNAYCSRSGIEIMHIDGKTEQETTNGYNLLDPFKLEKDGNVINVLPDGSFKVDTSLSDSGTSRTYSYTHEETLKILRVGYLYMTRYEDMNPYVYVQLRTGSSSKELSVRSQARYLEVTQEFLDDPTSYLMIAIYKNGNVPLVDGVYKISLYQDGIGAYEPYTGMKPAPNTSYPMPLNVFEATEAVSMGRNVAVINRDIGCTRCTCTQVADGTIIMKATGTDCFAGSAVQAGGKWASSYGKLIQIPKGADTVYIKFFDGVLDKYIVTFYDENKTSLGYSGVASGGQAKVKDGAVYVVIRVGKDASVSGRTYRDRVMFSFDPITEYVPPFYEETELLDPVVLRSCATGEKDEYLGAGRILRRCAETSTMEESSISFGIDGKGLPRILLQPSDLKHWDTDSVRDIFCTVGRFKGEDRGDGIAFTYLGQIMIYCPSDITTSTAAIAWAKSADIRIVYPIDIPYMEEIIDIPYLPTIEDKCRTQFDNEVKTEIEFRPRTVGER